jgi:hypothetical protein
MHTEIQQETLSFQICILKSSKNIKLLDGVTQLFNSLTLVLLHGNNVAVASLSWSLQKD